MNLKKLAIKMPKKRWTLKKEIKAQVDNLKTLPVEDKLRTPILDTIEKAQKIRNSKIETAAKVLQAVGGVVIGGLALFAAYSIDRSDEIPRNKNSMNIFNKLFKF